MRLVNELIVHCADTPPNWEEGKTDEEVLAAFRQWHVVERGWADIGYHAIIRRDGTILKARPEEKAGAHAKGHNANSLGVCLLGGRGSSMNDEFLDHYTHSQNNALRSYLRQAENKYGPLKLSGHNDYAAKACPGFQVARWYKGAPVKADSLLSSNTNKAALAAGATTVGTAVSGFNPIVQGIAVVGILLLLGFIIWDRVKKQKRGIL